MEVVESATAIGAGGTPPVIVFLGTDDPDRSEIVLREWIKHLEDQEDLSFREDAYKGFPTLTEGATFQHYALLDDYVLFTIDRGLLENTIDPIDAGSSAGPSTKTNVFKKREKLGPTHDSPCSTLTRSLSGQMFGAFWVKNCLLSCVTRSVTSCPSGLL